MRLSFSLTFVLLSLVFFAHFASAQLESQADQLIGSEQDDQLINGLNDIFASSSSLSNLVDQLRSLLEKLPRFNSFVAETQLASLNYYRFLPIFVMTLQVPQAGQTSVQSWASPCFNNNTAVVTRPKTGLAVHVEITSSNPVDPSYQCSDFSLFATVSAMHFKKLKLGSNSVKFNLLTMSKSKTFDIFNNGIRMFRFLDGPMDSLMHLLWTAQLFQPLIFGPGVNPIFAWSNVNFLRNYAGFPFEQRPPKNRSIPLDESQIHSGDFVAITRLDGLDPMIGWGMGGTTGHTAVALWFDDGLYICESTVQSDYWPTDGIQRTPYAQWIAQAEAADFLVAIVPLSDEKRAIFNASGAVEFFKSVEGLPYGYHNFLFGWLDTPQDNFPCLPPDYKYCLSNELVHIAAGMVDQIDRNISNQMYNQALMKRIDLPWGSLATTADILAYSQEKLNISFSDLLVLPEQDDWVYTDGKSMVCDVFVCSLWRAAGLFGDLADQIQCTELTPTDVERLNFFNTSAVRPQACIEEDPSLSYCQINGVYRLDLPNLNTVAPYANYAQKCPSRPPAYTRPDNC